MSSLRHKYYFDTRDNNTPIDPTLVLDLYNEFEIIDEKVAVWVDLSGKENHAYQSNSQLRPTVQGNIIEFDGIDDYMLLTSPLTGGISAGGYRPQTVFQLFKQDVTNTFTLGLGVIGGVQTAYQWSDGYTYTQRGNGYVYHKSLNFSDRYYVLSLRTIFDETYQSYGFVTTRFDNVDQPNILNGWAPGQNSIGTSSYGVTKKVRFKRILAYDRCLTDEEMTIKVNELLAL